MIVAIYSCELCTHLPTGVGVKYSNAHYGQGYGPIAMDNVGCSGSEAKLINCSYNPNSVKYDSHAEDVGVRCFQPGITASTFMQY